jgi:hypothetical protein
VTSPDTVSHPREITRAGRIRALRAAGKTLREIGDILGVSKSTINRALYPRVREYDASYNRNRWYTRTCVICGRPCTFNEYAKGKRGELCAACYRTRPFKRRGRDAWGDYAPEYDSPSAPRTTRPESERG